MGYTPPPLKKIRADIRKAVKATDLQREALDMKVGMDAQMLSGTVTFYGPRCITPVNNLVFVGSETETEAPYIKTKYSSFKEDLQIQAREFEKAEKAWARRKTFMASAIVILTAIMFVAWGWTSYFVQ